MGVESRKKPGVAFWATVVLVVTISYPLSVGPIIGTYERLWPATGWTEPPHLVKAVVDSYLVPSGWIVTMLPQDARVAWGRYLYWWRPGPHIFIN